VTSVKTSRPCVYLCIHSKFQQQQCFITYFNILSRKIQLPIIMDSRTWGEAWGVGVSLKWFIGIMKQLYYMFSHPHVVFLGAASASS